MNFVNKQIDYNDKTFLSCYDEVPLWSAPFGNVLLNTIEYKRNITALDIGFGTGFPLLELAMRLGASSFVYGIDPWVGAIKRTEMKAKQYAISNIKIFAGYGNKIPLPDNTIDLIVSNNGLNNILQLAPVIRECNRIAKTGCQFLMTMNLDTTMIEFYDVFKKCFEENGLSEHIDVIDKHIQAKRPKISQIENIFCNEGFKKTKEIHHEFFYKFADGTSFLNHYFIKLAFLESWINCIPVSFQDQIMVDVEKKINYISNSQQGFSLRVPFVCLEFRINK